VSANPDRTAGSSLSRTLRLWRFGGLSPWALIAQSARGFRDNQFGARSAQFAYYSLLALFPLLILILAVLARLPISGVLENSLEAADRGLPGNMAALLRAQVRDIQAHSTWGLIGGSALLLTVAGSRVFLTITNALNLAYGVKETRRFWQVFGMVFLFTVAATLLFLVALVLMIAGPMLSAWIARHDFDHPLLQLFVRRGVRWGVVCACLWIYTSTIYCIAPNEKLPWYWLSPGSAFAVVGWAVVSQGFRLYVENVARFNETYGAIGGVVVLIIWFHLTGWVLLMGGQINGTIHRAARS
jgi:membrane protein